MHSSYELVQFGGPEEPWVGNWGEDDGVGEMVSLGSEQWAITIAPGDYYGYGDVEINGLFMVFRNADGSSEVKNGTDDIFVDMNTTPPTSSVSSLSFSWFTDGSTVQWQNGSEQMTFVANTEGDYWFEVSNDDGCIVRDSIKITTVTNPEVNLGTDIVVCDGIVDVVLDAGSGYSYQWQDGATTQTYTAVSSGVFGVTIIDGSCEATDAINITTTNVSVDLGVDQIGRAHV